MPQPPECPQTAVQLPILQPHFRPAKCQALIRQNTTSLERLLIMKLHHVTSLLVTSRFMRCRPLYQARCGCEGVPGALCAGDLSLKMTLRTDTPMSLCMIKIQIPWIIMVTTLKMMMIDNMMMYTNDLNASSDRIASWQRGCTWMPQLAQRLQ